MKWMFLVLFASCSAEAATCISSDEQAFLWNQKYRSQFDVQNEYTDGSYAIEVYAPAALDELEFKNAAFAIGNEESPILYIPVKTFMSEGKRVLFYAVEAEMVRKQFLIFTYGEGCGISVSIPVEFN